ncbi:MAG: efflux RND transporter periplasmic adaptor subunit, partial [Caldimonas sp.]
VPAGAVGQASGQDFVWTIEKGALVRRIVITGRKDVAGGRVEVSKGLAADSQILAARFDNLKEGAPARVVGDRTASGVASRPRAPAAAASASQS